MTANLVGLVGAMNASVGLLSLTVGDKIPLFPSDALLDAGIIPDCVGTMPAGVVGFFTTLCACDIICPAWVGTMGGNLICGSAVGGMAVVEGLASAGDVDGRSNVSPNAVPRGEKICPGRSLAPDSVK